MLLDAPSDEEEGGSGVSNIIHKPVMLQEVISMLKLRNGSTVVDATLGMGGHAAAILEKILPNGRLIGIDKDEEALNIAKDHLSYFSDSCMFVHDDFRNLDKIIGRFDLTGVDAILFDVGVSSYQLESASRGFSIKAEGPLDMRMDRKSFISAYDLLNNLTEEEISSILWRFGQERFSRRIARNIVAARQRSPISSTTQLAELVTKALPYKARFHKIHPATRTFQALRIAVNRELDALDEALKKAALILKKRGRICVITFHSLEDRIVKENFRELARTGSFQLVFKKILRPGQEELKNNPRARSAKMRAIERVK
ncbi:MAG TPA: 16S rRNA (cytosine(1402)-N(4))-methyltransferase [Candidatus Omnitrophica bacterium]|nr:16S rRNA (cytosine(1402)-N(4))-methyltransferase [Candidatus Omnitrophota bacterium]